LIQQRFDPFRDRLSRDIRNDLSESLLVCLREHQLGPAREVADRFFAAKPGPELVVYIKNRLERYGCFLDRVATGSHDVLWQGLVPWDLGLRSTRILEHAWMQAQGTLFLHAMIRAAGVYIKQECGFFEAGGKMAAKALPVLEANREGLATHTDPERLLVALRTPQGESPILLV
jgi:uncharacterized protein